MLSVLMIHWEQTHAIHWQQAHRTERVASPALNSFKQSIRKKSQLSFNLEDHRNCDLCF